MAVRMTQGILLLCTGLPIDFLTRSPSSGKGVGELCLLLCLDMTDSFAIVLRICLSADTKREAHRGTMASGYRYHYRCPQCGTVLHLRMRVTVRQRRCPHCGVAVTCDEIDRQTIDESDSDDDQYERAGEALKKKMKSLVRETDPRKKREKAFRFLVSRGFPVQVVSRVIDETDFT